MRGCNIILCIHCIRKGGEMNNSVNKIYEIRKTLFEITDKEIEELREMAREQIEYSHPFKMATARYQNQLGEYNNKVLDKILELKQIFEYGANLHTDN